jgi:hypothetical protein
MQRSEIFIASPQQFSSAQQVADFLEPKLSYKGFFFLGESYILSQGDFVKENNKAKEEAVDVF